MGTPGPEPPSGGLLERRQLLVDLGQAGLLVGIGQGGVGLDLVALAEQVELADGRELGVGRGLEARQLGDLHHDLLLTRIGLGVVVEEVADLGLGGLGQVEKLVGQFIEALDQGLGHAVAAHIKETVGAAGLGDRLGDGLARAGGRVALGERADVNDWQRSRGRGWWGGG